MRGAPSHHHPLLCLPPAAALLQPMLKFVRCFKLPHRPSRTHLHNLAGWPNPSTYKQQSESRVARCVLHVRRPTSRPRSNKLGTYNTAELLTESKRHLRFKKETSKRGNRCRTPLVPLTWVEVDRQQNASVYHLSCCAHMYKKHD